MVTAAAIANSKTTLAQLWLRRLGFAHPQRILTIYHNGLADNFELPKSLAIDDFRAEEIDAYVMGKSKAHPHRPDPSSHKKAEEPFEFIYFDLKVVNTESWGGATSTGIQSKTYPLR